MKTEEARYAYDEDDDPDGRVCCCFILLAPIWPILSIAFGIVGGTISSTVTTLIVLFMSLFHFPLYLWKTLSIAATTNKCFKGIQGNFIWRLPVLLLAPIGPILYLLFWPIASATLGTLWQIGAATGIVYDLDYDKAAKHIKSNLRLEQESALREFLDDCRKVSNEDDFAIATIETIKGILTAVFGLGFACLAFVPFAIAMALVTVIRLPINMFKTMKIALFTVVLQFDLRIIVLLLLPLIHTLFPAVVFVVSMVGSFFWTWSQTTQNLFEDKSPVRKWDQLIEMVKDYYKEHQKFVSERCDPYDHPTGIPMGWNGQRYSLEIERIVRFQLKFLLCVVLMLYQTPIILVGSTAIVLIKYIPACYHNWKAIFRHCICDPGSDCVLILSVWPFYVLAIALAPVGTVLSGAAFILWAILESYWLVIRLVFGDPHRFRLCACLLIPAVEIRRCDAATAQYYAHNEDFRLVTKGCCPCSKHSNYDSDSDEESPSGWQPSSSSSSSRRERVNKGVYWDRFASQCIQSTTELLAKGFLDYDSVEGMDPSSVQSIPSVAILDILMDTLQKEGLKKGDIYWKVDETVCAVKGRASLDNIAAQLWPMVLDIQDFLNKHKKELADQEDEPATMAMQALLCDNQDTDESTRVIRKALGMTSEKQRALNNELRTKISRLVLAILRVRPFQERMTKIFEYKYENRSSSRKVEDLESQPIEDDDMVSVDTSIEGEADDDSESL